MIKTIKPYGSVNEGLVSFLVKTPREFLLVDKDSNQWGIEEATFDGLKNKGYPVKEVRRKECKL